MLDADCLATLTAKQCECLDLVLQQMTSKQIALKLGISPHTVNQRIDGARQKLGAATRQEAALRYAKLRGIPESLAYHRKFAEKSAEVNLVESHGLPEHALYEPFMLAIEKDSGSSNPTTVGGPQIAFAQPAMPDDAIATEVALPWSKRFDHGLPRVWWRLSLVLVFAALIMMVILVGVAAAHGLTSILEFA